jgi:hypothetical protein
LSPAPTEEIRGRVSQVNETGHRTNETNLGGKLPLPLSSDPIDTNHPPDPSRLATPVLDTFENDPDAVCAVGHAPLESFDDALVVFAMGELVWRGVRLIGHLAFLTGLDRWEG